MSIRLMFPVALIDPRGMPKDTKAPIANRGFRKKVWYQTLSFFFRI